MYVPRICYVSVFSWNLFFALFIVFPYVAVSEGALSRVERYSMENRGRHGMSPQFAIPKGIENQINSKLPLTWRWG